MTQKQLTEHMNTLYGRLLRSDNKIEDKKIIAEAVQLGMQYQEERIKEGINIVFNELNK